jgi:hypothetical protein
MHPKSPKLLDDVLRSCQFISEDAAGVTLDAYLHDRRMRQAANTARRVNTGSQRGGTPTRMIA